MSVSDKNKVIDVAVDTSGKLSTTDRYSFNAHTLSTFSTDNSPVHVYTDLFL